MCGTCSGIGTRGEMMTGTKNVHGGDSSAMDVFWVDIILRFLRQRRYWFRAYRGDRGLRHHY